MNLFKKIVCRSRTTPTPTRIVAQSRWMHKNQLEVGMYVEELDKPWCETGFMFQGFAIDSEETLLAVKAACENACVKTEKLARISPNCSKRLIGAVR